MAIFSRRRLQQMLDELENMPTAKGMDLLARLENKRIEQSLPAEMELGLLWALSKQGEVDIEPDWWGDASRPDAVSPNFLPGRLTAIEIAAVSDDAISGEKSMDRIALQMTDFADSVQKGLGQFLYFTFGHERVFEKGKTTRRRLVPENYTLSQQAAAQLKDWIVKGEYKSAPLEISEPGLKVIVERKQHKQIRYFNIFSSVPPEVYSIDDNPLSGLLGRKLKQLRAATFNTLRIVFLADVGSTLLRNLGRFNEQRRGGESFSGTEILSSFVQSNSDRLDAIVAFTPYRESARRYSDSKLEWRAHSFAENPPLKKEVEIASRNVLNNLPPPRFEGYQSRSLFRQRAFLPTARGWYLGVTMTSKQGSQKVEIPARALLDLLARRITPDQFSYFLGNRPEETELFERILSQGMTLCSIEMAPRNIDEDDDQLILHFSDDPAAKTLALRSK